MKKTLIEIGLAIVIVALSIWLYNSIMTPVRFDNEYTTRRDACATKLKDIRTLEEAYKVTYGKYTGDFDTLINRLLNEDSMLVIKKVTNYDAIPDSVDVNEIPELEAMRLGYISRTEIYVNPITQLREEGKLTISDEEIKNVRYVPYPKDKKYEFTLGADQLQKSGFMVPVFECKVDLKDLLSDLDEQLVINKIAELEQINRFPGWKVGDLTQSITDGNFE